MGFDLEKRILEKGRKARTEKTVLSEREIKILKFINEFGFSDITRIMKHFDLKQSRCYLIMKILEKLGLVVHAHDVCGRHGAYYLTQKGAGYTEFPALFKVSFGLYEHQLAIISVYHKLTKLYPEAIWISERRLILDRFTNGFGKKGHIPDGILTLQDGKQIAIEIELTLKAKNRMERLLKNYGSRFEYKEVWYFCAPHIKSVFSERAAKMPFIKIHNLLEYL